MISIPIGYMRGKNEYCIEFRGPDMLPGYDFIVGSKDAFIGKEYVYILRGNSFPADDNEAYVFTYGEVCETAYSAEDMSTMYGLPFATDDVLTERENRLVGPGKLVWIERSTGEYYGSEYSDLWMVIPDSDPDHGYELLYDPRTDAGVYDASSLEIIHEYPVPDVNALFRNKFDLIEMGKMFQDDFLKPGYFDRTHKEMGDEIPKRLCGLMEDIYGPEADYGLGPRLRAVAIPKRYYKGESLFGDRTYIAIEAPYEATNLHGYELLVGGEDVYIGNEYIYICHGLFYEMNEFCFYNSSNDDKVTYSPYELYKLYGFQTACFTVPLRLDKLEGPGMLVRYTMNNVEIKDAPYWGFIPFNDLGHVYDLLYDPVVNAGVYDTKDISISNMFYLSDSQKLTGYTSGKKARELLTDYRSLEAAGKSANRERNIDDIDFALHMCSSIIPDYAPEDLWSITADDEETYELCWAYLIREVNLSKIADKLQKLIGVVIR